MDILIKGVEIPESCGMCDAQGLKNAVWHFGYGCSGDIDDFANCPPARCPIIPLPEKYGRLIDADRFENIKYEIPVAPKLYNQGFDNGVTYVQNLILNAPTIIPAEEEKV